MLKLSLSKSDRNPARKPDFRPEALLRNIEYIHTGWAPEASTKTGPTVWMYVLRSPQRL